MLTWKEKWQRTFSWGATKDDWKTGNSLEQKDYCANCWEKVNAQRRASGWTAARIALLMVISFLLNVLWRWLV